MGVSHKYRCVFVGIPKNASTSIAKCLSNKTDGVHDHDSYTDIVGRHDTELMEHYFSFAFVRNPFDRLVSTYHHFCRCYADFHMLTFKQFVEMIPMTSAQNGTHNDWREDVCIRAQFRFTTLKIGGMHQLLVDKVLRYEDIQNEWHKCVDAINAKLSDCDYKLNKGILCKENFSDRSMEVHEYYDKESFERVCELYKKDFEIFGYPYEIRDKQGAVKFVKAV
jgi:chondroitin 4-sulfotransferase 11